MATTQRMTPARLKKQLKEAGVRLPHGYDVVKRTPKKKKKATTSKPVAKKVVKKATTKTTAKRKVARKKAVQGRLF